MTETIEYLTLALLAVAGLLALVRVGRGGSLPDKDTTFLDVLVVVTLLSFAGTITVARYVERRGARA